MDSRAAILRENVRFLHDLHRDLEQRVEWIGAHIAYLERELHLGQDAAGRPPAPPVSDRGSVGSPTRVPGSHLCGGIV